MKHFKSILTIIILAAAVVGVSDFAHAQKQQIKVCNVCGEHYKGRHSCKGKGTVTGTHKKHCTQCGQQKNPGSFPKNSNVCFECQAKNRKVTCTQCGQQKSPGYFPKNSTICYDCQDRNRKKTCTQCGLTKSPDYFPANSSICYMCQEENKKIICTQCGQKKSRDSFRENSPICYKCEEENKQKTCTQCGLTKSRDSFREDSNICYKCEEENKKKTCTQCGKEKYIESFPENSNLCKDCVRENSKKQCPQCGQKKYPESFSKNSTICYECEDKNNNIKREQERKKRVVNDYVNSMVYVAGGTFEMGATSDQGNDADSNERPKHSVTLMSFQIGRTEVTQELWEAVMGNNPSTFKGPKRPVENVSWDDCQNFIIKLNEMTGMMFRLPTEAEWEYAARGGNRSQGYKYSGSDYIDDVAVYAANSKDKGTDDPNYGTHNVATMRANELGIYDMSGNVWEWCSDWYSDYSRSAQNNPRGPYKDKGMGRVNRGGGWDNTARGCRVANRDASNPKDQDCRLGLRLAL